METMQNLSGVDITTVIKMCLEMFAIGAVGLGIIIRWTRG